MIKLEVLGFESVSKELKRMDRAVQKRVKKKVREGTNYLRDRVREATPKRSGKLKRSTKSSVRGFTGRVIVAGDAWYFLVVEYGSATRGLEGSLYSTKVLEREQPKAAQMIEDGVLMAING